MSETDTVDCPCRQCDKRNKPACIDGCGAYVVWDRAIKNVIKSLKIKT